MKDIAKLKLVKDWNGRTAGTVLPLVPLGQARLMVANGIAEYVNNPKRKRRRRKQRTDDAGRSEKAS